MNYKELLEKRRSVRDYSEKKVPLNVIHEIIQDACLAPSACDMEPWRFIIIQDSEVMKKISDESKKNLLLDSNTNPNSFFKQSKNKLESSDFNVFYNASSLVLICAEKDAPFLREDCSLAAAYFMIAATERGLATCWIANGAKIVDMNLRREIGLGSDLEVVAPLIIGYPNVIPPVPKRSPKII